MGTDILGLMVRTEPPLTDDEIVDELMSTLMAAQEPPSIALSWILDTLSRHPRATNRFLAALDSQAGDAAVKEASRLNPSAAGVLRRLTEPMLSRLAEARAHGRGRDRAGAAPQPARHREGGVGARLQTSPMERPRIGLMSTRP
jgi:hypothetical protein